MADLTPNIESNAQGPKRVTSDGTTVEQHSIKDQIEADRYNKSEAAAKTGGVRRRKLRHRGTVF